MATGRGRAWAEGGRPPSRAERGHEIQTYLINLHGGALFRRPSGVSRSPTLAARDKTSRSQRRPSRPAGARFTLELYANDLYKGSHCELI
ncbi:hypothetical protein EVAR_55293_1 [Eumeta japonica]|uniref:Uncharacterized protein n=1 Tax=Eumeta variegata TaxID=151549 RepID=A0A4C1ZJC7_EUMVA|nr:hypothetical protein EVAR_55293_1 [Eumeta japonica]